MTNEQYVDKNATKKAYETPEIIDHGLISELTETGGPFGGGPFDTYPNYAS